MGKVFFTTIIIFCIGLDAASTDFKIVTKGNKHGLADNTGNIVIPIIYDRLGWSNGTNELVDQVLGYFENGKWGLISTKNERLSAAEYIDLFPAQYDLLIASRKSTCSDASVFGILDTNGKARLGFQYHALSGGSNFFIAGQKINGILKWGVLDYKEKEIIPIKYEDVELLNLNFVVYLNSKAAIFSMSGDQLTKFEYNKIGELGSYSLLHDQMGRQGLADIVGNLIIQPKFKSIRLNNDNSVTVTEFPKWELIVPDKEVVKEFYYDKIVPVSHGIYSVTTNGRQAIINSEEEYLLNGNDWKIAVPDNQFVIVHQHNKYGVLKEGGISVLPLQYDSIYYSGKHFYGLTGEDDNLGWQIFSLFGTPISSSHFDAVFPMSENVIATRKNGYWGFIDFSGHIVIEYKYDSVWPFKDGRAKVNYLGNQGIINTAGEWVIHPNHSEVTIVHKDLFISRNGTRSDLIDNIEQTVFQTYDQLSLHSYGLLEITANNKYGLIDHKVENMIPAIYDYISELSGDQVYVLKKDGYYSVLGKNGRFILYQNDEYDNIGSFSEGFLSVKKDGKFGFIDLDGNLRVANRYDAVYDFIEGMAAVQLMGRWGFIDRLERLKIQPHYDKVENFHEGISIVSKNDLYGIIDIEGKEVLPVDYDSLYRNERNSFVMVKSGRYGLANLRGELLIPSKFEFLEENDNDCVIVKQRGLTGVVKKNGINVIPIAYEEIIYDQINGYYLAKSSSKELVISTR